MMHEEVDRPKVSKTDYRIEEIPLFLDYSNFMLSLFILVNKVTFLISTVNKVISFCS